MKKYGIVLFLLVGIGQDANAHPTSFKGSVGVMGHHSPNQTHNQINYSFEHWFAAGIHHFRRPSLGSERHATFGSANFLLKRWNGLGSQANLYSVLGVGTSKLVSSSEFTGLGLLQFDIEDRRFYHLTKFMTMINSERVEFSELTVRLGIAPYEGDFDELNAWIILEWQNRKFHGDRRVDEVTPLVRLFYHDILIEVGQSFSGSTRFNLISHF